jgi:hypothetical protein
MAAVNTRATLPVEEHHFSVQRQSGMSDKQMLSADTGAAADAAFLTRWLGMLHNLLGTITAVTWCCWK